MTNEGNTKGNYLFEGWSLHPGQGADPRLADMVSVHESLHEHLNASTAYGTLLHSVAWVARNCPQNARIHRLLEALKARSKKVHEAYATYLSLLVVGGDEPAVDLLVGNPEYQGYFDVAASIAAGLSGKYLRYHAVAASLRACMQGDAAAAVLAQGLSRTRISEIPDVGWPDLLLKQLCARLTPGLWWATMELARQERPELGGWSLIAASETNSQASQQATDAEYDATSNYLMERFHDAVVAVLSGNYILPFNGHLELVKPLLEAAEQLLPPGPVLVPLRAAAPGETPEQEIVATFKGERIVLREEPLIASFSLLPPAGAAKLFAVGTGQHEHLFVVARHTDRLKAQHRWPSGDLPAGDAPITALRRVSVMPNGERRVDYYHLGGLRDLRAIIEELPEGIPAVVSASMAVFGDETWRSEWLAGLSEMTLFSVLVDLDLFEHLRIWSAQGEPSFRYALMVLPDDHVPNRVFALQPDGAKSLFLAPCSDILAKALTVFLREHVPQRDVFREDTSFLEAIDQAAVGVLLGHLLREEAFFDFGAGRFLIKRGG